MFLFLLSRTHTWLHTSLLSDPAPRSVFPSPHKSRLSFPLSIAWVSRWVLLFRVWTFFFVSIFGFVSRSTHPHFLFNFFFIFSVFMFFYQSVAHGPFRRRDPLPTRWKLTSFCLGWDDQQCSHHREKGLTNTRSKSFLSGSSFKCVCMCKKRPRRNGRGFLNMI